MSNTKTFAESELDILSASNTDPNNRPIIEEFREEILALCEKFGNSGQSGGSAPYVASALSSAIGKLLLQNPISPITGIDDEWSVVTEFNDGVPLYQNKRLSNLFKKEDGRAYFLDAIVWYRIVEDEKIGFTGIVEEISSHQFINSFPFEPKTFHIEVIKEQLPEDWSEEPFYEGKDWYDTKEFEETGEKNWHKDKYRFKIKDKSQLSDVHDYYCMSI